MQSYARFRFHVSFIAHINAKTKHHEKGVYSTMFLFFATRLNGDGFWSGLHRPFSTVNDSWEYQDCETMSASLTFQNPGGIVGNQHCGVFKGDNYDVYEAPCSETKKFICLRFIGRMKTYGYR